MRPGWLENRHGLAGLAHPLGQNLSMMCLHVAHTPIDLGDVQVLIHLGQHPVSAALLSSSFQLESVT